MSRYYFHIQDGTELIQDPEGSELPTMEDARSLALKSAMELWADAITLRQRWREAPYDGR